MHAQRKQSLINAGYEAKSKKIKRGCRARVKSEAGYVSKNTLVASILEHHGTNLFISAQWTAESGFIMQSRPNVVKSAVLGNQEHAKEKGCPRDCSFRENGFLSGQTPLF